MSWLKRTQNKIRLITCFALFTLVAGWISGCAHTALNRTLDEKLEKMPEVVSHQELGEETTRTIENDSQLNSEQKAQLLSLQKETTARIDSLWQKTAKLRSVLIKDLINVDYNEGEVEIIKDKMRAIEDQKLETIFSAVQKANVILDKQVTTHSHFVDSLFHRN